MRCDISSLSDWPRRIWRGFFHARPVFLAMFHLSIRLRNGGLIAAWNSKKTQ